jgi:hypothetical protein
LSAQTDLVAAYNTQLIENAVGFITGERDIEQYPTTLIPYLTDDVLLHEAESLPWGGNWPGREGFLGEMKAILAVFGQEFALEEVEDLYEQVNEELVFHTFTINIIRIADPADVFVWRGVERYEFTDDKISFLDVFYKDTAGMMAFLGVSA